MPLNWNEDPEFASLDYALKKQAYDNYFDQELSDDEFRTLPEEKQQEIKQNFYSAEGLGEFEPVDTRSTLEKVGTMASRAARSTAQGVGDIFKSYQAGLQGSLENVDKMYGPAGQDIAQRERSALTADIAKADQTAKIFPDVESETPGFTKGIMGKVEQALVGMGRFAPAMAMAPGGPAPTFIQMYGMEYDRKLKEGFNHERAAEAATISSALQTPIESLGNLIQFGGLVRIAKSVGLGKAATGKIATVLGTIAKNAITEGTEEYFQQYAQNVADIYAKNPDATADEIYQQFKAEIPETNKQALQAAEIGAIGGGLLAGGAGVVAGGVNKLVGQQEPAVQPVDPLVAADAKIRNDLQQGVVSLEQLKAERANLKGDEPIAKVIDRIIGENIQVPEDSDQYWAEQEAEIRRQQESRKTPPPQPAAEAVPADRVGEARELNQRRIELAENKPTVDIVNKSLETARDISPDYFDTAREQLAKPRVDAEQAPARVQARAEVEPLVNRFMRRIQKKAPAADIEDNLRGLSKDEVKQAIDLVDPILKQVIGRRKKIADARKAAVAAGNPDIIKIVNKVIKNLGVRGPVEVPQPPPVSPPSAEPAPTVSETPTPLEILTKKEDELRKKYPNYYKKIDSENEAEKKLEDDEKQKSKDLIDRLDKDYSDTKKEIEDWKSRKYKENKTVVSGGGTKDDLNSGLTTISAANNRRRNREIKWREKRLSEITKIKDGLLSGESMEDQIADYNDSYGNLTKSEPAPQPEVAAEPEPAKEPAKEPDLKPKEAEKPAAAQPVPPTKPEKPSPTERAWVKNQWKPIIDKKEIKRGKSKGKFTVTLTNGKTVKVDGKSIRPIKQEDPEGKASVDTKSSTPKVDIDTVKKAFGNAAPVRIDFEDASVDGFIIKLPNDKTVLVDSSRSRISFDIDAVSKNWGMSKQDLEGLVTDGSAVIKGKYRRVGDSVGLIELLEVSGPGTLSHEKFHALFDLVFTNDQKERILERYGTEEKAAEAFRRSEGFTRSFWEKIKAFLEKLRNVFSGDVFNEKGRQASLRAPAAESQTVGSSPRSSNNTIPEGSPWGQEKYELVTVEKKVHIRDGVDESRVYEVSVYPGEMAKIKDKNSDVDIDSIKKAREINTNPERVKDWQKIYKAAKPIEKFGDVKKVNKDGKLQDIPVVSLTKGCQRTRTTVERVENGILPNEMRVEACYGGDCWVNRQFNRKFSSFENMEVRDLQLANKEKINNWLESKNNQSWLNKGYFIRQGQQGDDSHLFASGVALEWLKACKKNNIKPKTVFISAGYAPVTDEQYAALAPYKDLFEIHFSNSGWFHKNEIMLRLSEFQAAKDAGLNVSIRLVTNKDDISGIKMVNEDFILEKMKELDVQQFEVLETPFHDDAIKKKGEQKRSNPSGDYKYICCETGKCASCGVKCMTKIPEHGSVNASYARIDIADNPVKIKAKKTTKRGAAEILRKQVGEEKLANDIYTHAVDAYNAGAANFRQFRKAMRQRFADVWDKIKRFMKDLWNVVANERGSVRNPFGKETENKQDQKQAADTYLSRLMEDPLYKQYAGKMEQTKGGMDFKELKKSSDLFNWYNEKFGKGYIDDDMRWFARAFNTPYGLAKTYASMAKAMSTEINAAEARNKMLSDDWEGDLSNLAKAAGKNKKLLNEVRSIIWKYDGKKIGEVKTPWFKSWKSGEDIEANSKHYEELETFLISKGYSQPAASGFVAIRKKLDNKYIEIDRLYRSLEHADPNLIQEFRENIGKIHNYFPHRRTGDSYVQITDPTGEVFYREHYNSLNKLQNTPGKVRQRAAEWLDEQIELGALPQADYSIKLGKVTQLPDDVFFSIPVDAMAQIANVAGLQVEGSLVEREAQRILAAGEATDVEEASKKARKEIKVDVEKALAKAMAQTIQSRGWSKHAIPRKGIPGHETEDIFGILFEYMSGFAGFVTKIQRAKEHSDTLRSIDAKKHPKEYHYVSNYVRDMLANQDSVDRAVDRLRGIFFVRYLGFVIKSGFVNLTQNVVMAAPRLSIDTKMAHTKLAKAMKDTRRALTSKAAWMNKEVDYPGLKSIEKEAVKELHESGASIDQFLRELKGNMPGVGWSKHFKNFVDKSGIFMQIAEKFNRTSTGLAAFRVGYNEKFKDLNESERYSRSIDYAKEVIYDSHFVYGKHNLPSWARGGPVRKYLRSAYTFRSFTHNYLSMITHMTMNQGWAGRLAVARSLRNIFLLGGLTSIPFFKAFSEALYSVLDWDDDDALTDIREMLPETWLRDLVTYGLPGAAGVDISGSLSIEVPRNFVDIIGIPYAVLEDSVNSYKSWKSGQTLRALSETPFTPISVRNAVRGLELYKYGQYTRSGRAISAPGEIEAQQLTATEMLEKSVLGFQPVKLSKGFAAYQAVDKPAKIVENKTREFADRYTNALRRNDQEKIDEIIEDIDEWNQKKIEEGKPYLIVDPKKSIEFRLKPSMKSIPKRQRQNVIETYGAWE